MVDKFIRDKETNVHVQKVLEGCPNLFGLMMIICAKIGFEMGRIKRVFSEEGINWGFFNDHGNTWHCNAHLNNFVIC